MLTESKIKPATGRLEKNEVPFLDAMESQLNK